MRIPRLLVHVALLLVFVVLPTLYVLSAGPYVWLQSRGRIGPGAAAVLDVIYWPLVPPTTIPLCTIP